MGNDQTVEINQRLLVVSLSLALGMIFIAVVGIVFALDYAANVNNPQDPPSAGSQPAGNNRLEAPSRKMGGSRPASSAGDEKTRLVGGRRKQADRDRLQEKADKTNAMDDPVVGWLVIIHGPGKGRSLKLGYGTNSIGRGETNRISLNFGDDQISREQHTIVTYDPRGKKYYVQQGSGTNLTYLNDQPVLTPTELSDRNDITLGNTVVRFVPFCVEGFDWQSIENDGA